LPDALRGPLRRDVPTSADQKELDELAYASAMSLIRPYDRRAHRLAVERDPPGIAAFLRGLHALGQREDGFVEGRLEIGEVGGDELRLVPMDHARRRRGIGMAQDHAVLGGVKTAGRERSRLLHGSFPERPSLFDPRSGKWR
jgi:hypothetical protein